MPYIIYSCLYNYIFIDVVPLYSSYEITMRITMKVATGSPGTTSERCFPDGEGSGSFWSRGSSVVGVVSSR